MDFTCNCDFNRVLNGSAVEFPKRSRSMTVIFILVLQTHSDTFTGSERERDTPGPAYNEHPLVASIFFCIFLLVVSRTHYIDNQEFQRNRFHHIAFRLIKKSFASGFSFTLWLDPKNGIAFDSPGIAERFITVNEIAISCDGTATVSN